MNSEYNSPISVQQEQYASSLHQLSHSNSPCSTNFQSLSPNNEVYNHTMASQQNTQIYINTTPNHLTNHGSPTGGY